MFGFFVNGEFKGFWSNKIGDVFVELTCNSMNWDKNQTVVVFYPSLNVDHSKLYEATINDCKEFIEVDVQIGTEMVDSLDEQGNPIQIEQPVFEKQAQLQHTFQADVFYNNGSIILPC